MSSKKQHPNITMIVSMTKDGLVGNADNNTLKSPLDSMWFNKNTMGWPIILDQETIESMSKNQLKNQFCVSFNKSKDKMVVSQNAGGVYFSFGPSDNIEPFLRAIKSLKNFDNIFIKGSPALYKLAMSSNKPWSEMTNQPMVDTVVKTIFTGGDLKIKDGEYLDKKTMVGMSEPYFEQVSHYEFSLGTAKGRFYNTTMYHEKNHSDIIMPHSHKLGKKDIPFSSIRFEIWKRVNENSGR